MKNFYTRCLFAVIMFAAVSCTNQKIEIQRQVKITVSPVNVLTGFIPYKEGDLDMYDGSKLRISSFVYDQSGSLFHEEEVLVDDYNSTYSFSIVIPEGSTYKLVSFCSSIEGTIEKPTDEAYAISGRDNLASLKVKQLYHKSFYSNWSALGYGISDFSFENENVNLFLQPAVAYVTNRWTYIHAHDGESSEVYGSYTATAKDYFGESEYTWTITVERDGTSSNGVVIKNLDPAMIEVGLTADEGYNIFKGTIDGSVITVPYGQSTGFTYDGDEAIFVGGTIEGTTVYFTDLYLDISGQSLISRNPFGTFLPKHELFASLYDAGIIFRGSTGQGIDSYVIGLCSNDLVTYDASCLRYSSSLPDKKFYIASVEPANLPSSTNIYDPYFCLPESFKAIGRSLTGSTITDHSTVSVKYQEGKQYVLEFDCKNLKLSFREGTLSGTKSSSESTIEKTSKKNAPTEPGEKYLPKHIKLFNN